MFEANILKRALDKHMIQAWDINDLFVGQDNAIQISVFIRKDKEFCKAVFFFIGLTWFSGVAYLQMTSRYVHWFSLMEKAPFIS